MHVIPHQFYIANINKKEKNPTFKQRNPLQLNCPLSLTTYTWVTKIFRH